MILPGQQPQVQQQMGEVVNLIGPCQVISGVAPDGRQIRVLQITTGSRVYQYVLDPLQAAVLARELAGPGLGVAEDGVAA